MTVSSPPTETRPAIRRGQIPVPKVVKDLPSNQDASTNDWDTVFAIRFPDANRAIADGWAKVSDSVKHVDRAASDAPSYKIEKGVFGPWQLTINGDGRNIRMKCPFTAGTFATPGKSYDLKGASVVIVVAMEWVPDPDQLAFTISGKPVDPIKTDLDASKVDQALRNAFAGQKHSLASDATVDVATEGRVWMITSGKVHYYVILNSDAAGEEFLHVYQFEDSWRNNLKLLEEESGGQPAVNVLSISGVDVKGIAKAALKDDVLAGWFNANISNFNHVFSALDLSPKLAKDAAYRWLRPTATSYAVTDNGTLENSVFGVLTMTENRTAPTGHEVSPAAIPSAKGVNAGFLISGESFVRQMVLAGARTIFDKAPESSFDVSNDGFTVTNNEKLVWGRFKKDDKPFVTVGGEYAGALDEGELPEKMVQELAGHVVFVGGFSVHVSQPGSAWYMVSPDGATEYLLEAKDGKIQLFHAMKFEIEKGRFQMSLNHSYLEIQFTDMVYPENWEFEVRMSFTERVSLGLRPVDGRQIFTFDKVVRDFKVDVHKTKAGVIFDIIKDAVLSVVGLVAVVGPVVDGLRAAMSVEEVSEDAVEGVLDAEDFVEVYEESSEADLESNEEDGADNAATQTRGGWTGFKNAITATRWKAIGAIVAAGGAFGGITAVEEVLAEIAEGNWEKVPTFDEFADNAIVPYSWPGVGGYDLEMAQLATSLQIGLRTSK